MKRRIEETVLREMGWLVHPLVGILKNLDTFDYRTPATLMAKMQVDFNEAARRRFRATEPSRVRNLLKTVLGSSSFDEVKHLVRDASHHFKRQAAKDARYSLLLRLIKEADRQVPLGSTAALLPFNPMVYVRRVCEPADLLLEAHQEKGEVRARAVVRALRETAEMLYEPYLRRLWKLTCIIRREWQKAPKDFGPLVQATYGRLAASYPGLVEADAGWLRNAASHAHWWYIPEQDSITMWERKVPPRRIPVTKLRSIVDGMYQVAGPTLFYTVQLYTLREVYLHAGLLEAFMESSADLLGEDDARRRAAETALSARMEAVFKPLRSFFEAFSVAG